MAWIGQKIEIMTAATKVAHTKIPGASPAIGKYSNF
jgi:hypothetical protein